MAEAEKLVAEVISACGGEVIGRVRLQKIMYLLDRLGLGGGFEYEYHHYGPYSENLAVAVDGATADGLVTEDIRHRERDGMPYSVFRVTGEPANKGDIGSLNRKEFDRAFKALGQYSATVLELAATIDWLIKVEKIADWQDELRRRKGAKADEGRIEQAARLLRTIDLFKPSDINSR